MDSFYIFQFSDRTDKTNFTLVIFCSGESINKIVLRDRLKQFFETHRPPKKVIAIGGAYLKQELKSLFVDNKDDLFDVIPNFLTTKNSIEVALFGAEGKLSLLTGEEPENEDLIFKEGIYNIFKQREGRIRATSDNYHFVFPSGKHSPYFIRAGNILIHSAEITFIALQLLKYLKTSISTIYCDTSSINSLAYAALDLRKRFDKDSKFVSVVSFSSYDKFESFDFRDSKNALVIISATTSGKLVKKLTERHPSLKLSNIISLFYLSESPTNSQVICDLTFSAKNFPDGIEVAEMYESEIDCKLCQSGSFPVRVTGDIFLLEKPKVNAITIKKTDRPSWLNNFMRKFYSRNGFSLIRCYFGEEPKRRFEIFFKADEILSNIEELNKDSFFKEDFTKKFKKHQSQSIPAALKHLVYLNDEGSRAIALRIKEESNLSQEPTVIDDFLKKTVDETEEGAILIVCSCLATGNSVMYVNKYLRRFKNMSRTFFILFGRSENDGHFDFVKSNIGQGELGVNTNHFVVIERTTCPLITEDPSDSVTLSWSAEIEIIKRLIKIIEEDNAYTEASEYLTQRLNLLVQSSDVNKGGLTREVFLKNPINNKVLEINRSFAFFDFEEYHGNASQADIYFTIASVINNLRFPPKDNKERKIIQEEHIRTVIDPYNFNRFDDGIIQAAILRSASPGELNYKLDKNLSASMMSVLKKMIDNHLDDLSGEGLVEFLFALASKRMKIHDLHLKVVAEKIEAKITNKVLLLFTKYIKDEVLKRN